MRLRFIIGAGLLAALLGGSALAKTENPALPPFHAIKVNGIAHVAFSEAASQSVTVNASPALLKRLILKVDHGVLKVGLRSGTIFGSDGKLDIVITAPQLDQFDVAGATSAVITDLTGNDFRLHLSGTGSFHLQGAITNASLSISGAGSIDASKLIARNLTLKISGAGSVRAYASHRARIAVSGVGSARIAGDPPVRQVSRSGVGSVSFE